jgi:hypothetical protein
MRLLLSPLLVPLTHRGPRRDLLTTSYQPWRHPRTLTPTSSLRGARCAAAFMVQMIVKVSQACTMFLGTAGEPAITCQRERRSTVNRQSQLGPTRV